MNIGNILNLIAQNDIDPSDVFVLVEKVKTLDLNNETNVRSLIKEVSRIAKKDIDPIKEDKLVKKIMSDGVDESIFNSL